MATVEFVSGKPYTSSWGMSGEAKYVPVYAVIDGKRNFLRNLVYPLTGETEGWRKYTADKAFLEVERAKKSLIENGGKYFTISAQFADPYELLSFVKENDYTLEVVRSFFYESPNSGYMEFHGNCSEYSCGFHYRIYDRDMFEKLKGIVSGMKQKIR